MVIIWSRDPTQNNYTLFTNWIKCGIIEGLKNDNNDSTSSSRDVTTTVTMSLSDITVTSQCYVGNTLSNC